MKMLYIFNIMKAAAVGLTCKEMFDIFSQNEMLSTMKRVRFLEKGLIKYIPNIPSEKMDSDEIFREIRDRFDDKYEYETRSFPVPCKLDASNPFSVHNVGQSTCIWSSKSEGYLTHSLRGFIESFSISLFGVKYKLYCKEQS